MRPRRSAEGTGVRPVFALLLLASALPSACRDGEHTVEYYNNGRRKAEGRLVNGEKQGEWMEWDLTGRRKQVGEYVHDEREGVWWEYFRGKKWAKIEYRRGHLLSKTLMHEKKSRAGAEYDITRELNSGETPVPNQDRGRVTATSTIGDPYRRCIWSKLNGFKWRRDMNSEVAMRECAHLLDQRREAND